MKSGVAPFFVTNVSRVPFERACVAVIPFLIPLTVVLLIITFVPAMVVWFPNFEPGPSE